ncbi:MAG TPA: pyridoxal-5'-phosphate-dependent protein [Chloroflexi bacterium]|nr:pyridoxal-5'-phosphate-dependent protein [Chloroflexota bacterium]HRA31612.1 pyridoxal-phosphate dependent enzyme [Thermomicrobiales bacterium]
MSAAGNLAITFDDVLAAAEQLRGIVNTTPVISSRTLNDLTGREVFLKCESFQRAGSFKFRGAYNAISRLDAATRERGVVAYSSGNHAQGVAISARLLGIPAVIVMPDDAPQVKQNATRGYGAEIVLFDRQKVDGADYQHVVAAERGMVVIPPYDNPFVMAGQGTVVLELLEAVPDLDTLVIPIGGGGLIAGCAVAAKGIDPSIRIYGVETVGADDTKLSIEKGERVVIPPPPTIADGTRSQTPGELTFPVMQALLDDVLIVSDDQVLDALRFAITRMKLVIEPSAAVPVAAVMEGLLPAESRRVGIVISGGNIDPSLLGKLWD